jgi:hypothetical protein
LQVWKFDIQDIKKRLKEIYDESFFHKILLLKPVDPYIKYKVLPEKPGE